MLIMFLLDHGANMHKGTGILSNERQQCTLPCRRSDLLR